MKRLFDLALASVLLVLALPFMLFAAIGILLTSPGPVFYRAERMGQGGRPYRMYKFRTMQTHQSAGPEITGPRDARVFGFGAVLRKTKIDELPQLLNVLSGEMSIVGPRPEAVAIVRQHYTPWMEETLRVRPGMTSPGAIFGYTHGEALLDETDPEGSYVDAQLAPKLAIERAYMERASIARDLGVVVRTFATILAIATGRNRFSLPPEAAHAGKWYDFTAFGARQA